MQSNIRLQHVRCYGFRAAVLAALLLSFSCWHRVSGQQNFSQPYPPSVSNDPGSSTIPEQPYAGNAALVPAPAPGFWIVSTHASPQSFHFNQPQFCPGVTRFDAGVGFRQSSFGELCQSLHPGIPIAVFAHGSFVDWDSVCSESRCTWQWLQGACPERPLQVIYFTWPSDESVTPFIQVDIGLLGRRAARNGLYLADMVRYLPLESPLCLVGHSHGTRVVSSALHIMGGGEVQGYSHPSARWQGQHIRAVFAASAIDHEWFNPGERYDRALCVTECLLNFRNSEDLPLMIYPFRKPFSSRALGQTGFTARDRERLEGNVARIHDLDVTACIGHGHDWPEYCNRPALARAAANYIYFPDVVANVRMPGPVPASPVIAVAVPPALPVPPAEPTRQD